MKTFKSVVAISLASFLWLGQMSCVVYTEKDRGKHKGWFKNPKNPHHPNSTNPAGRSRGKSNRK